MKWIYAWILCASFLVTHAQEYHFRQMPTDYGRDIQHIKILFQGSDQMIWLGTDKGLFTFDGISYRTIPRSDKAVLGVSTIAENEREIWVAYEDGMVQIISPDGHQRTIVMDSILGVPVSKILFAKDPSIVYIATYGAGLWKMDHTHLQKISSSDFGHIHDIYDALIDNEGRLWTATDHGIWIYEDHPVEKWITLSSDDGLPDDIVTLLGHSGQRDVWIGFYDHGFGKYTPHQNNLLTHRINPPEGGNVVSITSGLNNDVWLATDWSIIHFAEEKGSQDIVLPFLIKDRIEDILYDRTGNIWIASGNKLFIANTQLEFLMPGIKGIQAITSLNEDIWLGCENGLYSLNLSTGLLTPHLTQHYLNILSIYHDPDDLLWIGTFGQGLYIYDADRRVVKHLTEQDGISNNSILNIDGIDKKVWLATLGGITEINWSGNPVNETPSITLFRDKFQFPAGYVYDVYVSGDQTVWFGTDGKGLYSLSGDQLQAVTKNIQLFEHDSFDLRTIYSITGDDKNNIWVSAPKGNILKLDAKGNILEHISSPYGSLNSISTSGQGEIIIVRESVIQIRHPRSGISYLAAPAGLSTFSPNINATAQDADGSVWIADTDKVLHYTPLATDTSHYVHMHLVDVTPGNLNLSDPIRLKPDSNFLDFRFTGLWYPDPQSVRYKYMLEGHDQDWIYSQEGRAVYSKLSPGTYTFIVSGSHNDDFTQSIPIRKEILVLPPFYQTWWFILSVLSLLAFLWYIYVRDRIRRLNKFHQLEKEKTTFQLNAIQAQVNPHFLFNSFNTLSGIIEEDQEAAVDYVDQLSAFFRGVLLHRNAELISIEEEIDIMRNYMYILKKRYGDNIRMIEDIHTMDGYIAPLTLQLLVENAIKHNIASNERPLKINISIDDSWLVVSNPIQPKFQQMIESTGFGLSSLLARYQYLTNTKIEIINDGNIFTVRIPLIHINRSHECIDR